MAQKDILQAITEEGEACGRANTSLDANPYRLAERKAAWIRGWHAGRDQQIAFEAHDTITPEEAAHNRMQITALRNRFSFLHREPSDV